MSLELLKEAIRVNNLLGEDTIQTIVENDIIVPDTKPDIARVLLLDGDAFITGCDAGTDRVLVSGSVLCKILYISDDEAKSVKSITSSIPFSYNVDMPSARSGMRCRAKGNVEHMEYNLLNGRKINIKGIINIDCRVFEEIDREYSSGVSGEDGVQMLKDKFTVGSFLGSNKVNYVIAEEMEIPSSKPAIVEMLRSDVKLSGKEFKVSEGKVIVKGDIIIASLYIGDDETRSMQYMEHELPFTQFIDLDEVSEDSIVSVDYELADYKVDAAEDSDGEMRCISAEASINFYVDGSTRKDIELLSDAYCPKEKVVLDKQTLSMDEMFAENKSQITIKDILNLEDCKPEVAEIFNVMSKHNVSDCKIEDGKVWIEGSVQNIILYLANNEEQPVFCFKKEIPFKHQVDIKGICDSMKCYNNLDIEHCNYSMVSSDQVEIRTVIGVDCRVYTKSSLPVITKISEGTMEEKKFMPSIIIYFAQPGDTLWKIAKKYNTTVDDILKMNNIQDKDVIMPGQQIVIMKKQ